MTPDGYRDEKKIRVPVKLDQPRGNDQCLNNDNLISLTLFFQ